MHRWRVSWLGDIVVPVLNLCARYSFEEYTVKARWSGSILHSAEHCAFINGYDFRKKPFAERKVLLRKALRRTSGGIQYVGHTEGAQAGLMPI